MPLAPSLTFEDVFGNTYQILCLIHLELEDGVLSRQGEVDDVHRKLLLCVVPISTGGNDCQGNRTPGTACGQSLGSIALVTFTLVSRTHFWMCSLVWSLATP